MMLPQNITIQNGNKNFLMKKYKYFKVDIDLTINLILTWTPFTIDWKPEPHRRLTK